MKMMVVGSSNIISSILNHKDPAATTYHGHMLVFGFYMLKTGMERTKKRPFQGEAAFFSVQSTAGTGAQRAGRFPRLLQREGYAGNAVALQR